jgi:Fic family protein
MTYVLQLAQDEHFEYSAALLRSLHFMMTEYTLDAGPGLWRPSSIWVRNDATGETVYEAPDAAYVPVLIDELVEHLAKDQDTPAMVRAAMAHLNLVLVHPFRDGNGRMARCLQTLVLARERILEPEFCSIEEYLGEARNTQNYYGKLAQVGQGEWTPENDARPWVRYCLEAHYIQATSVLRRIRESELMWTGVEQLMAEHRLPDRALAALFDAVIGLRVRNGIYRATLLDWDEGISNQTATSDLRAMVNAGLLKQHGVKRGTYYMAGEPLIEIRRSVRESREPIDASGIFEVLA